MRRYFGFINSESCSAADAPWGLYALPTWRDSCWANRAQRNARDLCEAEAYGARNEDDHHVMPLALYSESETASHPSQTQHKDCALDGWRTLLMQIHRCRLGFKFTLLSC